MGEISAASIAACIKDVFSTLAVVALFFAVIKDKIPAKNFRAAFDSAEFTETTLIDVANKIKTNLSIKFNEYNFSVDDKKSEINVNTGRLMSSKKDADELANLIDNAIILYIAENKK